MDRIEGPSLVLTVGPAASGKSTLLRTLLEAGLLDSVVSTDVIRAELGLPPAETDRTYAEARARVRAVLDRGGAVGVDATNVRSSDRAAWLAVAAAAGAEAIALRVGLGLDLVHLLVRDAGRDRHVPSAVIADQLAGARAATRSVLAAEGFVVLEVGAVPKGALGERLRTR